MFFLPAMNNPAYNDCYFSYDDGLAESLYVFIDGNNLVERFSSTSSLTIGETGFGTGLNLIALVRAIRDAGIADRTIRFLSVEKYVLSVERIRELTERFADSLNPEMEQFLSAWGALFPNLREGWNHFEFQVESIFIQCELFFGDVVPFLESFPLVADAWFLDGHSPDKNPDMWNETVLGLIGKNSGIGTTIATFSAAGIVKEGLRKGGFYIRRRKGFGGKRHMSQGWFGMEESELIARGIIAPL